MPSAVQAQRVIYPAGTLVGNASFIGALDALVSNGASVANAFSVRRLLSAYSGDCAILRGNGSGSPEATIPFVNGAIDLAACAALASQGGGTQAYVTTLYDQGGNGDHATQVVAANQPPFTVAIQSRGALGGVAASNTFLAFSSSGSQPFFVLLVRTAAAAANRIMLGSNSSSVANFIRASVTQMLSVNYGTTLTSGSTNARVLGVLVNGSNSAIYANGVLLASGNTGSNQFPSSARIGNSSSSAQSWFADPGSTISEVILFNGDPTAVAGWNDFISNTIAYFA